MSLETVLRPVWIALAFVAAGGIPMGCAAPAKNEATACDLDADASVGQTEGEKPGPADALVAERDGPADGDWKRWLGPAPADAPQPALVCTRTTVEGRDVWSGQKATFAWEVSNAGKGLLRILVSP